MPLPPVINRLVGFLAQIEGPYKWYIIGGVLVILAAIFTRAIFKTVKWLLVLIALIVLAVAVASYFVK